MPLPYPSIPAATIETPNAYLEHFDVKRHGPPLWEVLGPARANDYLTYLGFDEVRNKSQFIHQMRQIVSGIKAGKRFHVPFKRSSKDRGHTQLHFAIISKNQNQIVGMRGIAIVDPWAGSMESGTMLSVVGMDRRAQLEARFAIAQLVFDQLGYRRLFALVDAHNTRSIQAATNSGFTHEGLLRKAGGNFETAQDQHVFSMIKDDWPKISRAFSASLQNDNFNARGRQINPVQHFMK